MYACERSVCVCVCVFTGLYRGITATALRDVPSFGIYFGLYHVFVEALEGHKHPDDASPLTHIIAGGTAG